jgi:peptidoglycan/xylan/chitin deacetylase (PgdA/CDA1 family)
VVGRAVQEGDQEKDWSAVELRQRLSISMGMKVLVRKFGSWPTIAKLLSYRKRGPTVLFYHGVEEKIVDATVQNIHLELREFERQISYLNKHYQIVSLDDLHDSMKRRRALDSSHVVLTFDDGYRNNLQTVAPFLGAVGVPFAVFVSTKHIDGDKRFPTYILRAAIRHCGLSQVKVCGTVMNIGDEHGQRTTIQSISRRLKKAPQATVNQIVNDLRGLLPDDRWLELDSLYSSDAPMSWDEVKQLKNYGAVVGSHCHDHFILHEHQDPAETDDQLRISKERIEINTGECKYIAYPNGGMNDISANALKRVQENGYCLGLTTIKGEVEKLTSPYLLPRISGDSRDFDRFRFDVNGAFRHNRAYRRWAGG